MHYLKLTATIYFSHSGKDEKDYTHFTNFLF